MTPRSSWAGSCLVEKTAISESAQRISLESYQLIGIVIEFGIEQAARESERGQHQTWRREIECHRGDEKDRVRSIALQSLAR